MAVLKEGGLDVVFGPVRFVEGDFGWTVDGLISFCFESDFFSVSIFWV